jgi:hypothetical protein
MSDVVEQYTIRPIPESQRHGTAPAASARPTPEVVAD